MADKKADGGPAFPRAAFAPMNVGYEDMGICESQEGMTLRDYFAAKAPAPPPWWLKEYADCYGRAEKLSVAAEHLAAWAYEYADAMMAERTKS